MIDNTYLLWDIKADEVMVRILAWTEEDALQKAERLLPNHNYSILAVCEYWMPGVNSENIAKALDKLNERNSKT